MQSETRLSNQIVEKLLNAEHLDKSDKRRLIAQLQQVISQVDMEYLHALYFPETSEPARVPCRFGMPSAVFSQTFSYYVNTGNTGSGFIGIAPQDTTFYCCFSGTDLQADIKDGGIQDNFSQFNWQGQDGSYIAEKFTHARLVGCSMRVSYIGQRDEESGFLCGSHLFTAGPMSIDEQTVEDGFFKTQSTPSQGIRMVFLPKDEGDLEYSPQEFRLRGEKNVPVTINQWFTEQFTSDQVQHIDSGVNLKLQIKQLVVDDQGNRTWQWADVLNDKIKPYAPSFYWGQHEQKGKSQFPNLMVVYYRGMKQNKDSLRVDIVRHFEGIPREELRDFCGIKRRGPSDKAIDFVKKKSMDTKLHSHDLQDAKVLDQQVKPVLHKVVDDPGVVQTLPSSNKHWYDSLAALVPDLAGMAGSILGSRMGPTGVAMGGAIGNAMGTAVEHYVSPANFENKAIASHGGGVPYTGNVGNQKPLLALTY